MKAFIFTVKSHQNLDKNVLTTIHEIYGSSTDISLVDIDEIKSYPTVSKNDVLIIHYINAEDYIKNYSIVYDHYSGISSKFAISFLLEPHILYTDTLRVITKKSPDDHFDRDKMIEKEMNFFRTVWKARKEYRCQDEKISLSRENVLKQLNLAKFSDDNHGLLGLMCDEIIKDTKEPREIGKGRHGRVLKIHKSLVAKNSTNPLNHPSHEFVVGYALNSLLSLIPNFAFTVGMYNIKLPGSNNKTMCLVQERIMSSVTLDKFIVREDITISDYCKIVLQIVFSLALALDKLDFTHYDLHSSNILIKELRKPMNVNYGRYSVMNIRYVPVIIDMGYSHVCYEGSHYGKSDEESFIHPHRSNIMYDINFLFRHLSRVSTQTIVSPLNDYIVRSLTKQVKEDTDRITTNPRMSGQDAEDFIIDILRDYCGNISRLFSPSPRSIILEQ